MKSSVSLFLLLLCFLTTSCSSQSDISGKWYGSTDVGGFTMRIIFDISKSENNYSATMLSPDQTTEEINVTSITFSNNELSIAISTIGFAYTGRLTKEGIIEGNFVQSGQSFPLNLSREEIKANLRTQEPEKPYPYNEEEVLFFNKEANIELAGTLTIPNTSEPFTSVVLVSGSGPQNRDEELMGHKPFLVLADYLTRQGIAVLRFDDRGVGKSQGIYNQATLDDFASDVKSAIEYLKTRKEINKDKVGIIGHSEGGAIAFMLGSEQIPAFIVTLAAPGVNGQRLLHTQREELFKASNIPEEYIAQFNEYMRQAQIFAIEATSKEELRKNITSLFTGTPMEKQIDPAVEQLSSPEIVSFLKYDPAPYFKKIHCPVLALNGMKDLQVPCGENLAAILEGISSNGNKDVTTKPYFNLNHLFQAAGTGLPNEYGQIEETINPEVLKDITDWILKR